MNFNKAAFLRAYGYKDELPESVCAELVFCGRSNVGKSTLINKLCGRRSLARVSATPGKTTTINFFSLDAQTMLVDLPGYGYARRPQEEKRRWAALMEHYFRSGRDLRLVLLLLDSRHKPSQEDFEMLDFLRQTGSRFLVVLTKTDKLNKTQYRENLAAFDAWLAPYAPLGVEPFTANGNEAAERLRASIARQMGEEASC